MISLDRDDTVGVDKEVWYDVPKGIIRMWGLGKMLDTKSEHNWPLVVGERCNQGSIIFLFLLVFLVRGEVPCFFVCIFKMKNGNTKF